MEINVIIRAPESTFDVRSSLQMFVGELKFCIAPRCGIHESHQRMIYQKINMDDTRTLESYKLGLRKYAFHVVYGNWESFHLM